MTVDVMTRQNDCRQNDCRQNDCRQNDCRQIGCRLNDCRQNDVLPLPTSAVAGEKEKKIVVGVKHKKL